MQLTNAEIKLIRSLSEKKYRDKLSLFVVEGEKMAVSYKKLWKILIDKDMKKKDLAKLADVSTYTITKMSKGENVTTDTLGKICKVLECNVEDIMEFIPDNK